jgi:hypothetical protein
LWCVVDIGLIRWMEQSVRKMRCVVFYIIIVHSCQKAEIRSKN